MSRIIEKIKSISKIQILAILLILGGLAIMIPRGMGMLDFYKEAQYAREHNFAAGNLSPELLRPWMTLRYISVAYAVPQKYLFDATGIQPKNENSMTALSRLNGHLRLGQSNGRPALMDAVAQAIVAYRANPVATGLIERQVSDWMSIQYIANSTGIPAESIFQQIGIPMDGNAYLPLGFLSDTIKYTGGPKALTKAIQAIVDAQGIKPVTP